jgi:hypothetical protein
MTRAERNKDYELNFEHYVTELMKLPDARLEKKLEVVRIQMELASKITDEEVYQTLNWWEMHIMEARIRKTELTEEAPYYDEMEAAIADMETIVVRAEERQEIMEETLAHSPARKPKIQEDNSSQTSLF